MSCSNKGEILKIEPNAQLKHTFWTGIGGDKDMPEHYSEVSFTINEKDDRTVELTYLRTGIATETETQMFQMHIQSMLVEITRLLEE
ncbi:MAG: SRPBCC domain-containing protein [Taibaiella sp.]|nr:SRPBCC domain-containing protein [Taibaiella sp.]MBX9449614.1 SRPBCC domain-containing protein [Taibaiella sp.]